MIYNLGICSVGTLKSKISFPVYHTIVPVFIYKTYRELFKKKNESKVVVPILMYYFAAINCNYNFVHRLLCMIVDKAQAQNTQTVQS